MGFLLLIPLLCWGVMIAAALAVRLVSRPDTVGGTHGLCGACGYSLAGLRAEHAKCPECGAAWSALPYAGNAKAWKSGAFWWGVVFVGGILGHVPGAVGCVMKTTYWDPLYTALVVVLAVHAAVSATVGAIVSGRRSFWLTVVSALLLTAGMFGLEAWWVISGLLNPPTNRIDLQYEDLAFWSIPVFSAVVAGVVFVTGGVIVAVYLWFRGPELVILQQTPSPQYRFQRVEECRE